MRKLSLIAALALALTLAVGLSAALAAPGSYEPPLYDTANDPAEQLNSIIGTDDLLNGADLTDAVYGEGEKESVVFGATPEAAGAPRPDGTYEDGNANKSGEGTGIYEGYTEDSKMVRRAVGNDYIHGQFKTNTNACASCHMTHTAAGDALLIKNGIYNTCTACHDGTLGKLNVFDLPVYDATVETASFAAVGGGTFGGEVGATQNASMHLPTGYLELAAAPGGNRDEVTTDLKGNDVEADAWKADFTCSSCHQPHGSYSDRLLAPNPANIERQAVTVADWVYDPADGLYKAWANKDTDHDPATPDVYVQIKGPWVFGESYQPGYTQTVFYYAEDATPDLTATPMVAKANQLNEDFAVNYAKGIGVAVAGFTPDPAKTLKVAIVPALVVKVERGFFEADGDNALTDYTLDVTDGDNTNDAYVQGLDGSIIRWDGEYKFNAAGYQPTVENYGLNGITWFCAACHTDYYADKFKKADGSTSDLEGKYSSAYRHTINRGALEESGDQIFVYESGSSHGTDAPVLTCLGCHYAHGTTKDIMRDADDARSLTVDVNPSSALKRYVNMAVCWKCHTQQHGDELMNASDGYWNSTDVSDIKLSNGYEEIPQ